MAAPLVYFDGRFVPQELARLPLSDAGFVWGATVTDRVRTYNRQYFRLLEHLARFRRSCDLCRIPQRAPDSDLTQIAERLLHHNAPLMPAGAEIVLVLLATPGEQVPNLILYTEPLDASRHRPPIDRGAHLVIPTVRHVPDSCIPRAAKMRSRMHWWLAERQVKERDPDAQALLVDADGSVTETAIANFAIVRDNAVITPPEGSVLPGISMEFVRELCAELEIVFQRRALSEEECLVADEALLTSTPFGIVGVSSLNGLPIHWPGPMLRRLSEAWSARVGVSIHGGFATP